MQEETLTQPLSSPHFTSKYVNIGTWIPHRAEGSTNGASVVERARRTAAFISLRGPAHDREKLRGTVDVTSRYVIQVRRGMLVGQG